MARKIIFTIGNNATIVNIFNNKILEYSTVFSRSDLENSEKAVDELFLKYRSGDIYILIDVNEQSYIEKAVPHVGALSKKKVLENRLNKEFSKQDIKNALFVKRNQIGKRDDVYVFISTPMKEPLVHWLKVINKQKNPQKGIFMLPVETANIVKELNKNLKLEKHEWELFVSHNYTGGLRQTVIRDGKVIYSRMVSDISKGDSSILSNDIDKDEVPEKVIKKEINTVISYLKTVGFSDERSKLRVYLLIPEKAKEAFDIDANLSRYDVKIFSEHNLVKILGTDKSIRNSEHITRDNIIATHFASTKPILKFTTAIINRMEKLIFAGKVSSIILGLATLIFLSYAAFGFIKLSSLNSDVKKEKSSIAMNQGRVSQIQSEVFSGGEFDQKTLDMALNHSFLTEESLPIGDFIKKFASIKEEYMNVKKISFATNVNDKGGVSKKFELIFELEVDINSDDYDRLFDSYEKFILELKKVFEGYEVEYNELPEKIKLEKLSNNKQNNSDPKNNLVPVKINIFAK